MFKCNVIWYLSNTEHNRIYSGSGAVHGKITKIEHSKKQESKGCKCWNEHVIIAHIVKLFNKELII